MCWALVVTVVAGVAWGFRPFLVITCSELFSPRTASIEIDALAAAALTDSDDEGEETAAPKKVGADGRTYHEIPDHVS